MSNLYYFCIINIICISEIIYAYDMYLKLNFVTIRFDDTVPHHLILWCNLIIRLMNGAWFKFKFEVSKLWRPNRSSQ